MRTWLFGFQPIARPRGFSREDWPKLKLSPAVTLPMSWAHWADVITVRDLITEAWARR